MVLDSLKKAKPATVGGKRPFTGGLHSAEAGSSSVEAASSKSKKTAGPVKRPAGRAPHDKTGKPMVWNTSDGAWQLNK